MKIAFVSLPVAGHLNPMLALAAEVQSRGDDVILLSVLDAEDRTRAAGLKFIAVGQTHLPLGVTKQVETQFSQTQGEEALKFTFDLMGTITGALIREIEVRLALEEVDGVVFDTYQPYLELSAIALELPYVHVSNAAPFDVSGVTPLCFFDWEPLASPEARERNLQGVEQFRRLLEPSLKVAKEYAEEKGLAIDWQDLRATRSRLAWITQLPAVFDFEPLANSRELFHAGPFSNESLRVPVDFPWEKLGDDPLIYVSMGTLQNGIGSIFQLIIKVARRFLDLQLVVAVGDKLDFTLFHDVPSNVVLVSNAPQLALLKRASLCVTHAGLNTVLESLTYGVPMIGLPVTNDQPGVAARIRDKGVGDYTSLPALSEERLEQMMRKILHTPSYRTNALAIANTIRHVDGLALAAKKIHTVFSKADTHQ